MGSGTFRLKGSSLLDKAKNIGVENMHQLHLQSRITYQTVLKYFGDEGIKQMDLRVLATLLFQGCGYSPEELKNVKFGDIFEYVDEENGAAD